MDNAPITQLPAHLLAAKQAYEAAWDRHSELIERIFTDRDFDPNQRAAEIIDAAAQARRLQAEYHKLYNQHFGTDKETP